MTWKIFSQIKYIFAVLLGCLLFNSNSNAVESLQLNKHKVKVLAVPYVNYLKDPDGMLTLSMVANTARYNWKNDGKTFNKSFNNSTWWLHIPLENSSGGSISRLMEISYPLVDYIDVYILPQTASNKEQRTSFHSGDKLSFVKRPIQHRNFLIPIELQAHSSYSLFIRIQSSSSVLAPITFWDDYSFFKQDQSNNLLLGIYFGTIMVAVIYCLLGFVVIRQKVYVFYSGFILSMALFTASFIGLGYQYLWPEAIYWNDKSILIFISCLIYFGTAFSYDFLKISTPRLLIISWLLRSCSIVFAMLSFIFPYSILITPLILLVGSACIYATFLGLYCFYNNEVMAKYYTAAWSCMLLGAMILSLTKLSILPSNYFTEYAFIFGAELEILVLSFCMAVRGNNERLKRLVAENEVFKIHLKRQAQENALILQKKATKELEIKVKERTIALQEANIKLQALSHTDQLTGLYNRRFMDKILRVELEKSVRKQSYISFIMLDIDHFKSFNDQHGHLIGDDCLCEVALSIESQIRSPDYCGRYGGEEFCVVLAETDHKRALNIAERIRSRIEELEYMHDGQVLPITISAGVATMIPTFKNTASSLISAADDALYKAKKDGRNQVSSISA